MTAQLSLELSNWMCHEALRVDLEAPVTMIVGANGVGKSSIVDAIEFVWCGTGLVRGIKTKTELGALSIREGADECRVTLSYEGVEVTRSMDRTGAQTLSAIDGVGSAGATPIEGKLTEVQEWVTERLRIEPKRLRAVLCARNLFSEKEEERRAVLFGAAADAATNADSIRAACLELGVSEGERLEQAVAHVVRSGWDAAYDTACSKRAEAKGKRSALVDTRPVPLWSPPWIKEQPDVKPIDLSKIDRDQLLDRIATWQATLEEEVAESAASVADATARKEEAHRRFVETSEELEGLVEKRGTKALEDLERDVAAAENGFGELEKSLDGARAELAKAEAQADAPESLEPPELCHDLPGATACVASKTAITKYAKTLREQSDAAKARIPELRATVDKDETLVEEARSRVHAAENAQREASATDQQIERVRKRMDEAEQTLGAATSALDQARAAESRGPDDQPDKKAFARTRVERLRLTLERFDKYAGDVVAAGQFEEQAALIEAERDEWDAIAQALKPTGARSVMVRQYVDPFVESLNEVGGFLGKLRVASDLSIEMEVDGQWRRYVQLSDSQRLRVELAVSHALASAAGLPFLIFDRVDALDVFEHGRGAAIKALAALVKAGPYTVALSLSALGRPEPTAIPLDDVDTWWLKPGGTIEHVARASSPTA